MRSFPTRSVLAGACTLALIGGTAATLSPVNAAPPATSNTVIGVVVIVIVARKRA